MQWFEIFLQVVISKLTHHPIPETLYSPLKNHHQPHTLKDDVGNIMPSRYNYHADKLSMTRGETNHTLEIDIISE